MDKFLKRLVSFILGNGRSYRSSVPYTDSPEVYNSGTVSSTGDAVAKQASHPASSVGIAGVASLSAPALFLQAAMLGYSIYQDQRNWNQMSPSDKKTLQYQDEIADSNATLAYMRQRQFQEDYLMPRAQLNSLAQGYADVGLNKMGLAGFNAGASSSSAPQASSGSSSGNSPVNVGAVIGQLLGAVQRSREIDIEGSRAEANNALLREQAEGQRIENRWRDRLREAEYNERLANAEFVRQNTAKIFQDTKFAEIYALYAPAIFDVQLREGDANAKQALANVDKLRSDVHLNSKQIAELDSKIAVNRKLIHKMDGEIAKLHQECLTLASQRELNDQMIVESKKRMDEIDSKIVLIGKQAGLTQKEIDFYRWNHAHKYTSSVSDHVGPISTSQSVDTYNYPSKFDLD